MATIFPNLDSFVHFHFLENGFCKVKIDILDYCEIRKNILSTEFSNYWMLSIAICIVFDMFLFDLFIVVVAKEVGSNPRNLKRLSKFFRFRGYYD